MNTDYNVSIDVTNQQELQAACQKLSPTGGSIKLLDTYQGPFAISGVQAAMPILIDCSAVASITNDLSVHMEHWTDTVHIIKNCSNIIIQAATFTGPNGDGTGDISKNKNYTGYGVGQGLWVRDSNRIYLDSCTFNNWRQALKIANTSHCSINYCNFVANSMDHLKVSDTHFLAILNNKFLYHSQDPNDTGHPDHMQLMYSKNNYRGCSHVAIAGNFMSGWDSNTNEMTKQQGLFAENHKNNQHGYTTALFEDWKVYDNLIVSQVGNATILGQSKPGMEIDNHIVITKDMLDKFVQTNSLSKLSTKDTSWKITNCVTPQLTYNRVPIRNAGWDGNNNYIGDIRKLPDFQEDAVNFNFSRYKGYLIRDYPRMSFSNRQGGPNSIDLDDYVDGFYSATSILVNGKPPVTTPEPVEPTDPDPVVPTPPIDPDPSNPTPEEEIATLKQTIITLDAQIVTLQDQINNRDLLIGSLSASINSKDTRIATLDSIIVAEQAIRAFQDSQLDRIEAITQEAYIPTTSGGTNG